MILRTAALATAVAALLAWSIRAQDPAPPPAEVPGAIAQALRTAIDGWAAAPGHHGVSAAIVFADGARWTGTAGLAGPAEPLRPDHLIQIASITKTMTAAVILQLVDEGIVRLDDPLGRWLETRTNVDPDITVRQLLNHTAGLANYTLNAALGRAANAEPTRVFTPDELLAFAGPPRFAPGERTEYTNTAFLLLGLIAERAGERSILDLYHQRLWIPLGLEAIFMPGLEDPPAPVADVLGAAGVLSPLDRVSILSIGHSAFGLMADAATVARWGDALFRGRVVSEAMQAEMRTLVPAAGNIPGETGAGLGIRSYTYLDRVQYGHSGGASFGSSLLLHDPESGVTVAVIMNQGAAADHFVLAPTLLEIAAARR